MPKSKRAKIVHLTKTDKKGKELSLKLFANVQEAAETFQHIFVFSVENMRNSYLKGVRNEFADSRYVRPRIPCNISLLTFISDSSSARQKSWPKPWASPPQKNIFPTSLP